MVCSAGKSALGGGATGSVACREALGFTVIGTVPEAFDHPRPGLVGLHVMHGAL